MGWNSHDVHMLGGRKWGLVNLVAASGQRSMEEFTWGLRFQLDQIRTAWAEAVVVIERNLGAKPDCPLQGLASATFLRLSGSLHKRGNKSNLKFSFTTKGVSREFSLVCDGKRVRLVSPGSTKNWEAPEQAKFHLFELVYVGVGVAASVRNHIQGNPFEAKAFSVLGVKVPTGEDDIKTVTYEVKLAGQDGPLKENLLYDSKSSLPQKRTASFKANDGTEYSFSETYKVEMNKKIDDGTFVIPE
jgi:hypothetical protein